MAKDFFGNLGQALSKTAKELSGRAEDVYETQRLKNKISAEERQIDKIMADLGKIVYQRYKEEVPVDDAQKALCEQIDQRMEQIEQLRTDINELKIRTRRICPSCGKEVEKNAAFCKFCGAACPTQEEEEDAGDTIDGTAEEVEEEKKSEESAEEAAETETETEAACTASLCISVAYDCQLRHLCDCLAAGHQEIFSVNCLCQQKHLPSVVADLGSDHLSRTAFPTEHSGNPDRIIWSMDGAAL